MSTTFKSADLVAMDRTVRAGFSQAFSAKEGYIPWTPRIAAMETSSSAANLYPFGIDSGNFREWAEGERHVNSVGVGSVAVTNVKRELTYGVKREMIDDDMTGALRGVVGRVRSAAGKLRRLPDRLMAALLNANPTSLSGSTLFNGSHVIPGTARTFDNDFGSTSLTRDNAVAMRSAPRLARPGGREQSGASAGARGCERERVAGRHSSSCLHLGGTGLPTRVPLRRPPPASPSSRAPTKTKTSPTSSRFLINPSSVTPAFRSATLKNPSCANLHAKPGWLRRKKKTAKASALSAK